MAYIGKQPLVGNYQTLDALVATTTDTYALTKDTVAVFPQTPANCIVSLNGVIQAPFDSYTISGSDIVFDSALTGSDSIDFITVLGDVLNIGTPSDNTVSLAKLTATGTKDATTFLRGDNTFQTIGTNTPAFEAYASSDQTGLGDAVWTKLTIDTELFDTDSNFASSRFTPTTAGKYFVYLMVGMNSETLYKVNALNLSIYKNGSQYRLTNTTVNPSSDIMNEHNATVSAIIDFNGSSDYVEGYTRVNVTSGTGGADIRVGSGGFGAYRIIE